MRTRIVLIGYAIVVAGACGERNTTARNDTTSSADTMAMAAAFAVPPRFDNLTCSPEVLGSGDVLSMKMSPPHGPTVMALAPDGTQYLVVFHGEGTPDRGKRTSLLPPDSFARATELNLDPKLLMAAPWLVGRDTNELLFRQPGFYRLIVGSDLETDGPSYAECVVRFVP